LQFAANGITKFMLVANRNCKVEVAVIAGLSAKGYMNVQPFHQRGRSMRNVLPFPGSDFFTKIFPLW
jgi:hypothetical protein